MMLMKNDNRDDEKVKKKKPMVEKKLFLSVVAICFSLVQLAKVRKKNSWRMFLKFFCQHKNT